MKHIAISEETHELVKYIARQQHATMKEITERAIEMYNETYDDMIKRELWDDPEKRAKHI